MRWFRTNSWCSGWVALFALTLQLGLSFGHLHLGHAHATTLTAAVDAQDSNAAPEPSDSDDEHESHYCAIYAINALLSGAQIATAPVIPAVAAPILADVSIATSRACSEVRHHAFRSRAPPLS
jgi:hypothetical protein